MKKVQEIEVRSSQLALDWDETMRPDAFPERDLEVVRIRGTELRILEEHGRIFLVINGESPEGETEVRVDLEDLLPRSGRLRNREILEALLAL